MQTITKISNGTDPTKRLTNGNRIINNQRWTTLAKSIFVSLFFEKLGSERMNCLKWVSILAIIQLGQNGYWFEHPTNACVFIHLTSIQIPIEFVSNFTFCTPLFDAIVSFRTFTIAMGRTINVYVIVLLVMFYDSWSFRSRPIRCETLNLSIFSIFISRSVFLCVYKYDRIPLVFSSFSSTGFIFFSSFVSWCFGALFIG